MSLFHEEWRKESYYPRQYLHLRDLPQNHLKRCKEVPFQFHEYRVSLIRFRLTTNSLACPMKELWLNASIIMELRDLTKPQNVFKWLNTSRNVWLLTNISQLWRDWTLSTSPKTSTAEKDIPCLISVFDELKPIIIS